MASLYGVCIEDLTYTPNGTKNPRTGETSPGTPRPLKGFFRRKQVQIKNSQGQDSLSEAEALLLPDANPVIGERLEGLKIENFEEIKEPGQLLGYRVWM